MLIFMGTLKWPIFPICREEVLCVASKKTRPISPFMWGGFKTQIGKAKKFEQILTGNCRKNLEVPPINEEVGRVHLSKGGNLITLLGTDGPTKTDEVSEKLQRGVGVICNPKIYIAKFGTLNRAFSA